MPLDPRISKFSFFVDVARKVIVPAPLPEASTAPVSLSTTRQAPIAPTDPAASRTTTRETVVADPHFTEKRPVDPLGCQYVLIDPSTALP